MAKGFTLERRDGDGSYEPPNCYWATRKEQNLNRRKRPGLRSFHSPLGVRFTAEVKAALEKLAKTDDRSISYVIGKIVTDDLRARKLIK
jgi:hypothetical protein